jgi:predicted alpha/beta-fold hydrolase
LKHDEPRKGDARQNSAETGEYFPPFFLFGPHLETIYPAILRRVQLVAYTRERIDTPDADFLDLDWLRKGSGKVAIISHGLEGNSHRPYVRGMAKALFDNGFDVLAWNFRGCSEEMNHQLRFYHSGATDDLDTVITHASNQGYIEIYLVGFSLGGNMTLKYLGERTVPDTIKKAVVFSVPLDLKTSCEKISQPANRIYSNRFLRSLKSKVIAKSRLQKGLDVSELDTLRTLEAFDDRFTAPLHGFANAADYYERCSSIHFVENIRTKTLIVNTRNDPFLSAECFPVPLLKDHPCVRLEIPLRGGHVGFTQFNKNGLYWSEQRALDFFAAPSP